MDAESGQLFLAAGGGTCLVGADLVFSASEKPLQDWVVDPDSVSLWSCDDGVEASQNVHPSLIGPFMLRPRRR